MAVKKRKAQGRPQGSPNSKNNYVRDERFEVKCSEGFNKIVVALQKELKLKSKADVLHTAIQQMAFRTNFTDDKDKYWVDKIQ